MASLCNLPPFKPKGVLLFNYLGKVIAVYHQSYDKFLLIGDFNAEDAEPCLSQFLFEYDAKTLFQKKNMLLK